MFESGIYRSVYGDIPIWPTTDNDLYGRDVVGWVERNEIMVLLLYRNSHWFVVANQYSGWVDIRDLYDIGRRILIYRLDGK